MNRNTIRLAAVLAVLALLPILAGPAQAALRHDPGLHWRTLTTQHFDIHFHDGEERLAREVAAIAERVHRRLSPAFDWRPATRTQLVLSDRRDYANGSAIPLPRNTMTILVTPPRSESSINDYRDWLDTLITHEYAHILHLDERTGLPAWLQRIFGRQLLLFPNLLQPPWFIEGLATWYETDTRRGIGRGQNSQYRALMRMEVARGIKSLRQVNQPLESWPMNTTRYLYGVYFYQFVADRHGDERVQALVREYRDNLIPFMINSNSRRVLGETLGPLWAEFERYLERDFGSELERIRARGITPTRRLTRYGYYTGFPRAGENGELWFTRNDAESEPVLMRLRAGHTEPEAVAELRSRHIDWHPEAGILAAEIDATRSTNLFADLYRIDPETGRKTRLTRGGRYLYAAWSPDGREIVAVHNAAGQSALHRLDARGRLLEVLWSGQDHSVLGAPDWSPDGRHLAMAVWRPDGHWNLERFDLQTRRWQRLTDDNAIQTPPRYSRDGRALLYSADHDGVFNLQRLDLASGEITTLSNLLGAGFGPVEAADGGLWFTSLGEDGFDIHHLPAPRPRPTPAAPPGPGTAGPPAPPVEGRISDYSPWPRLAPTGWLPWIALGDDRRELGAMVAGEDPLARHRYELQAAWDSRNGWPVGRLGYVYDRWNPTLKLRLQRQVISLRDDAGRPVHFRDSDSLTAEAVWPFFRYARRWALHAGIVSNVEADKRIEPGYAPQPALRDRLVGLALNLDSSRRYARSISPAHGRQVRLIAEDNDLLGSDSTGRVYTLDWREFVDLPGQQVLAARLVAGWGTGNPRPFRLGGSLAEALPADPREAALAPTDSLFNHRRYALRGYADGLRQLTDRRMALLALEWRFPIALVERGWMAPPLGLHKLHGSLFVNTGETWRDAFDAGRLKTGIGAELTTRLVLGYWLPLDLRLGYAYGLDDYGTEQIYLDLGGSF